MTCFGDWNLKFPMILAISVSMSSLNFMLSRVEYEKTFINSGPECYNGDILSVSLHTMCTIQASSFGFFVLFVSLLPP